jgi:hypothetical protein
MIEPAMRFGLNLRGDLAKLSDADIASRFEILMADREALFPTLSNHGLQKSAYQNRLTLWFGRGLLHARIFYELYALLTLGPFLKTFRKYDLRELYLLDCELKDVRDEVKRRVALKKAIPAT